MKKLMKVAIVLMLVAVLTVSFFSCGTSTSEKKSINAYIPNKMKGFDPSQMTDLYTTTVAGNIMEPLFEYKYLTDTYQLKGCIAKEIPTVESDGLTYVIELKKGVKLYDPEGQVFPDKVGRDVTAHDYVYTIKRLADPAVNSGGWWLYDGVIAGLNEWRAASKDSGNADYSQEIEGIKALDDYTLQVKLTKEYPQFLYTFAMSFTFATIKEVVDYYGEDWVNHPVGTGPYYYDHERSIIGNQRVLVKNPEYRDVKYPSEAGKIAKEKGITGDAGKKLPFVDEIVYYIIEESTTGWLKMMNGELDAYSIPKDNFDSAMASMTELSQDLVDKGIKLDINTSLDVTYTAFQMDHGFLSENLAVRRAMSLAQDIEKTIEIFYNGRAQAAQTCLPPGLGGWDPNYENPYAKYDVEKAKSILAEAGYPGGKGIPEFTFTTINSTTSKQMAEFFQSHMEEIGIKITIDAVDWPTLIGVIHNKEAEIWGIAWGADYPDAQNFLQLLYGPNGAPGPNGANFDNPKFNELYEKGSTMMPGSERDKIYEEAAQLAAELVPWIYGVHRKSYGIYYKWYKNKMFRDIGSNYAKYKDIDVELKKELLGL